MQHHLCYILLVKAVPNFCAGSVHRSDLAMKKCHHYIARTCGVECGLLQLSLENITCSLGRDDAGGASDPGLAN